MRLAATLSVWTRGILQRLHYVYAALPCAMPSQPALIALNCGCMKLAARFARSMYVPLRTGALTPGRLGEHAHLRFRHGVQHIYAR